MPLGAISGSRAKAECPRMLGVLSEPRFSKWLGILPSAELFNKVHLTFIFSCKQTNNNKKNPTTTNKLHSLDRKCNLELTVIEYLAESCLKRNHISGRFTNGSITTQSSLCNTLFQCCQRKCKTSRTAELRGRNFF